MNWNEEKIKNNNNIKVLTRTIFDILFKNTTCLKESEHSFPSENPSRWEVEGLGVCVNDLWFRRKHMSLFGLTNLQSYPHQCDILLGRSRMCCFCYQLLFVIREWWWYSSLWASSPEHSGGGVGKGRGARNDISGIWISASKSWWELLIGEDDISNDFIILGMCFSIFVYICARFHFTLIGRNLTAQSTGSHRGTGRGIKIPETYMYLQDLLPFPAPPPERPGEFARRLVVLRSRLCNNWIVAKTNHCRMWSTKGEWQQNYQV